MKTIKKDIIEEFEIKKSKFFSYIYCVDEELSVNNILENLRKEHKFATHVTYAYVLHSPATERCSDDGEPSGTAGKPILDVIKKNELTNVLVVVVRYFGGIKLGAGGLVRAYSNSAKQVVDNSEKVDLNNYIIMEVKIGVDNKYIIDNNSLIKVLDVGYSNISDRIVDYRVAVIDNSIEYDLVRGISKEFKIIDRKLM